MSEKRGKMSLSQKQSVRSGSHVSSSVSVKSDRSKDHPLNFSEETPSAAERLQYETLDSDFQINSNHKNFTDKLLGIFQDLENKIIKFIKNELEMFKKILQKENTQNFVKDFNENRCSNKEAALDLTLCFLREMKQDEAADTLEGPGPLFTPHLPATTGGAGTLPEHHCRYRHRVAPHTPTNWPAEGHHTCLPAKHELLCSNSAQCDHTRQTICSGSPPTLKHNILYQQSETVKADYKTYKKPATASSESTADNRTGHKGGRPQLQNLPSSQKSASHCESPFKRHGLPPHNDHLTSAELSPYGLQTTQRCLHKDC
ncbi:hypothetical protein G5714_021407 [Onychostoma macrolepis]|uniref:Uncharacterized protein n=1 Tax=Onychostoma macrolepis TaxID=369639 RepID=A0A7J6BQW2_9TELE|nr:hypothetical protein G5714_021407 [Onychostoma macrolepis]